MAFCNHDNVIIDEFRFKINQLLQLVELTALKTPSSGLNIDDIKEIKARFLSHNDTLEDLCYIEKKLISIAPKDCLDKYYLQLLFRYKEVLPKESEKYIYNKDGETAIADEEILRKETLFISGLLHKFYHFLDNKEKVIAKYKMLFITLLLIMFAVSALSFAFTVVTNSMEAHSRLALTSDAAMLVIASICAGYFGAIISIVRRIQGIAEENMDGIDREDLLLKLVNGKWGIFLSIVLGTLAPFVLLLLLVMLQDTNFTVDSVSIDVLPKIQQLGEACGCGTKSSPGTAMSLLYGLRFETKKDIAEYILLSIACGFSERFVPDVLDRVSKELEAKVGGSTTHS